jgi:hypothetical protein
VSPRIGLAAGGLVVSVVVAALVLLLAQPSPHLAATNTRAYDERVAIDLAPGQRRCQGGEYVPAAAARLRLTIVGLGTAPAGPLAVALSDSEGHPLSQATTPVERAGPLDIPLAGGRADADGGSLCLQNLGRARIAFEGNLTSSVLEAAPSLNGPGERPTDEVRTDYYLGGRQSWFTLAPTIASRFADYKPSWVGAWTLWVLIALALALAGGAMMVLRLALRTP